MEYTNLGKSGLQISRLSLGSWLTFGKQIGDDVAERLMDIAYENGINFFDNAEIYARGKSEIVMGNILKKKNWSRDSYIVSSKVCFGTGGQCPVTKFWKYFLIRLLLVIHCYFINFLSNNKFLYCF